MANFNIFTAFRAKDEVTPAFNKMGKGAAKFGDKSSKAFQRASRSGGKFNKVLKGFLVGGVLVSTFLLLKQGIRTVSTEFISFDQAVTSASAKFKDLNLSTEAGQKTLLALKKTARDVGAATQFTAGQAAQGLDFLAMAGFNAQQSMSLLPGVVDLATVANVELGRATDIASDSLGAFGLMTKDSAQLTKNFTRINDVMALTMARTNTGIEDMFEAVKDGAPTFTAAGQSVESFNALMGIMANSGVKGSKAGVQLRNIMLSLAKPTGEAADLISEMGIKTQDARGDFRDIVDIIEDFEKATKKMGTAQKSAALKVIFGKRSVTGFNILLKAGTKEIRNFRGELKNAGGKSKEMADIMRQSLGNQLKALGSAAIEVGFKFFTAFEKQGAGAIKTVTEAIRNFDVQPMIEGVSFAYQAFKSLVAAIKPLVPILPVIVAGFVVYNAALKIQLMLQAIQGFLQMTKAIKAASGAMAVFNAIMAANPIGIVITAVTALIALLVLLQNKFKIFDQLAEFTGFKFLKSVGGFFADPLSIFSSKKRSAGASGSFAPDVTAPNQVTAPNKAEVAARRERIDFQGKFQFAGAPLGSTVEGKTTGAPPIGLELLGVNP